MRGAGSCGIRGGEFHARTAARPPVPFPAAEPARSGTRVIPRLVSQYAERALPDDRVAPRQIRMTQEGLMWLKPGTSPRRFTASQHTAVETVAFAWHARFRIARVLAVDVVDAYAAGAGTLAVRMLGRTLQRQTGPETSAGEALRYLAELPLTPFAMTANAELRWRDLGDRRAAVSIAGQPALEVTFEFDGDGDIVRAASDARPFRRAGGWTPTPWSGRFSDYRELGGMRVPTAAEVGWDPPEGRFVYWRGRILAALALDTPFVPER
jgi:hypothetical protein